MKTVIPAVLMLHMVCVANGQQVERVPPIPAHQEILNQIGVMDHHFTTNSNGEVDGLSLYSPKSIRITTEQIELLPGISTLETLSISGRGITDDHLLLLSRLTLLKNLDISRSRISGTGLQHLVNLAQLRALDLTGCPITDEDLEILSQFPNIESLSLYYATFTDDSLRKISKLKTLTHLNLTHCTIGKKGMSHLARLTNLEFLELDVNLCTPDNLAELKPLGRLKRLSFAWGNTGDSQATDKSAVLNLIVNLQGRSVDEAIRVAELPHKLDEDDNVTHLTLVHEGSAPQLTDEVMAYVKQLKYLESLTIEETEITDKGILSLSCAESLKELTLAGRFFTGRCLDFVTGCKQLETLTFHGKADNESLSCLAELNSIHKLDLTGCPIDSGGLVHINHLRRLTELNLSGTQVEALDPQFSICFPKLRILNLAGTKVTDADMNVVGECTSLIELDLGRTAVSDSGVQQLDKLVHIQEIRTERSAITSAGRVKLFDQQMGWNLERILAFEKCKVRVTGDGQKQLTISGRNTGFGPAHYELIGRIPDLQILRLIKVKISAESIMELKSYPDLKWLFIYDCNDSMVDNAFLAEIVKIDNLEQLNLISADGITDEGLLLIAKMTNLKRLSIGGKLVTDAGIERLKEVMPECDCRF